MKHITTSHDTFAGDRYSDESSNRDNYYIMNKGSEYSSTTVNPTVEDYKIIFSKNQISKEDFQKDFRHAQVNELTLYQLYQLYQVNLNLNLNLNQLYHNLNYRRTLLTHRLKLWRIMKKLLLN